MPNSPDLKNLIPRFRFLVTGGAGFIGSHLAGFLLDNGAATVRVLDNLSTGYRHNFEPFLKHSAFEFMEGDIRDLVTTQKAVSGMDYIFHQAALGSVPRSMIDPIASNEVNVSGFLNMLVSARDAKVKRFIYAASSSTYGDSAGLPKVEERIGNPLSPYAVTKYVNELYARVFATGYGMEITGLRYFNVFGPRQDPNGAYAAVIPRFIDALIRHESPVINGDGTNSRDFTFIENVIQANLLAAFAESPEAVNTVYNVAYGEQTNLNQLVALLKELLAFSDAAITTVQTIYGPNRPGDIPHSLASVEKARRLLGYDPLFDFAAGLKKTVAWHLQKNAVSASQSLSS